jgi:hypothetical protein
VTQYSEEWWYANGDLAANQRAAIFGPGNNNDFAPIFSDPAMTVPLANPTTTDALGVLTFYAPDGLYFIFVGPVGTGDSVEVVLGSTPGAVDSVNGQTGDVVLGAVDVGAQPIATIDAKGDLYAGTGPDATARLPVGADGEFLVADSGEPTGLAWAAGSGGAVDSVNGQTGVVVLTAGDVAADPAGSAAAAAAASQPLATIDAKGDLYAGTANNATTRLPVGADGRVLMADSGQPTGLTWGIMPSAPVSSVNGQTGVVVLVAGDVGADPAGSAAAAAAASQPLATIDAKGDLYVGTADSTTARLAAGADGRVLTTDSGQATGLVWAVPASAPVDSVNGQTGVVVLTAANVGADPAGSAAAAAAASQPLATIDAKGDLYAGTGDNATARRSVGVDGQVLTADSGQATGLTWTTPASAPVSSVNGQTGIVVLDAVDVGADVVGAAAAAAAASQPLATIDAKGDLYVGTAADTTARLAAGADGFVLTADAAQATGLKWAAAPVDAGAQQRSVIDAKGDLYVGTANDTTARQAVGTDGFGLVADSTLTNGLGWKVRSSLGIYPRAGYSPCGVITTVRSSKSATLNTMFLTPVYLLVGATLTGLAFEVTANIATAVTRLGIYGSDAAMLPTGSPIADYGTVASDTTGTKTAVVSTPLAPGLYWIAVVGQTAAPTLRHAAGQSPWVASAAFPAGSGVGWNNAYAQTGVSGALPAIGAFSDSDAPLIGLKF